MPEYKNILSVWLNISKDGQGVYYAIKNDTNEPIKIEPGRSIFANINNKRPVASKSVKIEDSQQENNVDVSESIPF